MRIILFSESDYNFSAKLAKICNLESDELLFFDNFNSLQSFKNQNNILLIIDFNDYKNKLDLIINLIKSISSFPVCVLVDKIQPKIQKEITKMGFDIIMSKAMFLMNIKTIKSQVNNNFNNIQKQ
tara:strand:+ start:335 stop:709 length:375 start_codon:yes stop_codon:yes gene_type:complete